MHEREVAEAKKYYDRGKNSEARFPAHWEKTLRTLRELYHTDELRTALRKWRPRLRESNDGG